MEDKIRDELDGLPAETLALQTLFVCLCKSVVKATPHAQEVMKTAFDDAANVVVNHALERGVRARAEHTLAAVRMVEQLRASVLNEHMEPKRDG